MMTSTFYEPSKRSEGCCRAFAFWYLLFAHAAGIVVYLFGLTVDLNIAFKASPDTIRTIFDVLQEAPGADENRFLGTSILAWMLLLVPLASLALALVLALRASFCDARRADCPTVTLHSFGLGTNAAVLALLWMGTLSNSSREPFDRRLFELVGLGGVLFVQVMSLITMCI